MMVTAGLAALLLVLAFFVFVFQEALPRTRDEWQSVLRGRAAAWDEPVGSEREQAPGPRLQFGDGDADGFGVGRRTREEGDESP